jgi:hypothetical protein
MHDAHRVAKKVNRNLSELPTLMATVMCVAVGKVSYEAVLEA